MDLLKCFGYRLNGKGEYVYQSTESHDQMINRENAANEFQNFYNDLKKIKEGSLDGFEDFIIVIFLFKSLKFQFELIFLNLEFI